jgi:hypothetical protein
MEWLASDPHCWKPVFAVTWQRMRPCSAHIGANRMHEESFDCLLTVSQLIHRQKAFLSIKSFEHGCAAFVAPITAERYVLCDVSSGSIEKVSQ